MLDKKLICKHIIHISQKKFIRKEKYYFINLNTRIEFIESKKLWVLK